MKASVLAGSRRRAPSPPKERIFLNSPKQLAPFSLCVTLLSCIFFMLPPASYADSCPTCGGSGYAPCPACGGSGISGYVNIHGQTGAYGCERCGGVRGNPVYGTGRQGTGRIPCPTCNGTGQVESRQDYSSGQSSTSNQYEEARKALEEQQKKKEEKAKRKQEEFEKKKQEALKRMKGIHENELGLKGIDAPDDIGLKGVGETGADGLGIKTLFEKPTGMPPPVDTRAQGPSKLDVGEKQKPSGGVDPSVVDLRDVKMEDLNKGLMKNQWEMSIDWRYKHDPVVQKYINDLWATAHEQGSSEKLERILVDQLRASGRSPQEVDDFFAKVHTFLNGEEQAPKKWDKASKLARELDGPSTASSAETEQQIIGKLDKAESITADVSYMAPGKQARFDCVLHAIANGAQVPLAQVEEVFKKTVQDLGMKSIAERRNPDLVVTDPDKGGRGGLNPLEELLVSEILGDVIAVPRTDFAKVIESTGRPVITTIYIQVGTDENPKEAPHEVVVTGVYRTPKGEIYYRVMDSNLADHKNFTTYVEKYDFEGRMTFDGGGGFVVMPKNKK